MLQPTHPLQKKLISIIKLYGQINKQHLSFTRFYPAPQNGKNGDLFFNKAVVFVLLFFLFFTKMQSLKKIDCLIELQ